MKKGKLMEIVSDEIVAETKISVNKDVNDIISNGLDKPSETFIEKLLTKLFNLK